MCGACVTPILLCVFWAARVRVYVCVCDTHVEVMLRLHAHSGYMGVCGGGTCGSHNRPQELQCVRLV